MTKERKAGNRHRPHYTLTIDELKAIADALGVTFEQSFTLPDGTQLKINN